MNSAIGGLFPQHTCFGCGKELADYDEHIHFTMDEWSEREGLEPLGIEGLNITLCTDCTQDSRDGWHPESHEVPAHEGADKPEGSGA